MKNTFKIQGKLEKKLVSALRYQGYDIETHDVQEACRQAAANVSETYEINDVVNDLIDLIISDSDYDEYKTS